MSFIKTFWNTMWKYSFIGFGQIQIWQVAKITHSSQWQWSTYLVTGVVFQVFKLLKHNSLDRDY